MAVTNVTLEVVQREYQSLREAFPKFCGCDTCRGDVLVYALNRLSPHYVSTRQGEILTELSLHSDQEKAKLDVALLEGFRKVALAPRCGAKTREGLIDSGKLGFQRSAVACAFTEPREFFADSRDLGHQVSGVGIDALLVALRGCGRHQSMKPGIEQGHAILDLERSAQPFKDDRIETGNRHFLLLRFGDRNRGYNEKSEQSKRRRDQYLPRQWEIIKPLH